MTKVITLLGLILAGIYWAQTQKLKSLAIRAAKQRCKQAGVQLLDHTVVHSKRRFVKDLNAKWRLQREYQFEFTSTGEQRYLGKVVFLGAHPVSTELEAYSLN